jgi:hypothetical protein
MVFATGVTQLKIMKMKEAESERFLFYNGWFRKLGAIRSG